MILRLDNLPGNEALKASLRTALERRFPQAVLLSGSDGSGKTVVAQALAAALLCTGTSPHPCGICSSCHKLAHNTHPDCIVIDEGDSEIKVETARRIRNEASILPNEGDRKVFILHHADRMNTSAQNALLKILEEPPNYVFFILISAQPGVLLQTIRSRCVKYQLEPPTSTLVHDPSILESIGHFLTALAQADEYNMLKCANTFANFNKAQFQQVLSLLKTALRDAILSKTSCPPLLPVLAAQSRALGNILTNDRLLALCDHCTLLARRTEINASAVLQCAVLTAGAYHICYPSRSSRGNL